jgi:site-specific DNA-methyltransferase (adenine-specific)
MAGPFRKTAGGVAVIEHLDAKSQLENVSDVDLFCFDPPYFGIVADGWDNQWERAEHYVEWLADIIRTMRNVASHTGSLVFFQGVGKHGVHPIFDVLREAELAGWHFRNWITWKKRRAYGKKNDYLFCREEILWLSADPKKWTFNIPLLDEKRGYDGWDKAHPAKSEYKRVSNVWSDIPELMRPERTAQKPLVLIERLVRTHSNEQNFVVDPFVGWGTTAVVCAKNNRRFVGCDVDAKTVVLAQKREKEALCAS